MTPLLANAGSALLMLISFHLSIGNVLLGLVEAVLLRIAFRVPLKGGASWMIPANLASMIGGAIVVSASGGLAYGLTPLAARWALVGAAALFWAATVVVEWPFVAWAMGRCEGQWPRAFRASLLVQTVTYAALGVLYLQAGPSEVLLRTHDVDPAEIGPATRAHVYYLDDEAAAVWRVALDGGPPERVLDVAGGVESSRLDAAPAGRVVRVTGGGVAAVPVDGRIAARCTDRDFDAGADAAGQPWTVERVYGSGDFLRAEERATGRGFRLAAQTPFLWWPSRDATVLPGGVVVYALGPHIVSLDLATRRLAVLARGRSPVVVIEEVVR